MIYGDPPGTGDIGGEQYKVNSLYDIHPIVLGDLATYFANNLNLIIPNIDQVPGYQDTTPYVATTIMTEETRTSTIYGDLTTVGPTLSSLPDGLYMITYSAAAKVSAATTRARMNISINGAAPNDSTTPQAYTSNTGGMVGVSAATSIRISGGTSGNTVKLQYAIGTGGTATGTWGARALSAVRISN